MLFDILCGLLVVILVMNFIHGYSKDETDSETERSGMVVYTDHATGCQYLSNSWGIVLTPRLDKDGKIVCIKKE